MATVLACTARPSPIIDATSQRQTGYRLSGTQIQPLTSKRSSVVPYKVKQTAMSAGINGHLHAFSFQPSSNK